MTQPSLRSVRRISLTAGGAFGAFYIFYAAAPVALATGSIGAGVRVGIVMLIVVVVQPFVPILGQRGADRRTLVMAAVVSMGVGSALMPFAGHWPGMVLLGVGFGVFVVASTAWVKETAPPEFLAKALGIYGFGSAIGGAVGAPIGVYLAQAFGSQGTALAGALVALVSVLPARGIARSRRVATVHTVGAEPEAGEGGRPEDALSGSSSWGWGDLVALGAHLLAVSFYAYALSGSASPEYGGRCAWLPVLAAFTIQSALAGGRMIGGWAANRWTPFKVGAPVLILLALGTVGFTASTHPVQILAAMSLVGVTSGAFQIVALIALMNRAHTTTAINRTSAAWNICFDIGLGLGALTIGAMVA